MTTLLTGIAQLATQDDELGEITDAALVVDGARHRVGRPGRGRAGGG